MSRLREQAEREEGLAYLEAARVLFALDDPTAPGAEADLDGGAASAADAAPGGGEDDGASGGGA
jgi:hypothetical protein